VDEEGRYLPAYADNTFGGSKSYHVVGELHDFFGGYFHNDDYGFGHWARHEDMPGQKLWLWALSREGGVWEDLLTDTDGQYVEFQAGRLLVQYSPGSHVNPITEARFDPMSASRWTETWFPVEGIGGLTEASRDGAMSVSEDGGTLTVSVNAFKAVEDTLRVWSNGVTVFEDPVSLAPLELFETDVEVEAGSEFRVQLPGLGLDYASDPSGRRLSRPFETDQGAWPTIPGVDRRVFEAKELMKGRRYAQARSIFEEAVETEPWNREALLGLGELAYRRGLFAEGLGYVNRVLQLDAYDAEANFLAGLLYRALAQPADAQDAFGWAARSVAYRSAAYVQLAELKIIEAQPLGWWRLAERAQAGGADVDPEVFQNASAGQAHLSGSAWAEAIRYARLAIESDRLSVRAWQALGTIGRWTGNAELIQEAREELLALDPLHHFVAAEEYLEAPGGGARETAARRSLEAFGGEYLDQAVLELAIQYANLSMYRDALLVLNLGAAAGFGAGPVQRAWGAMMDNGPERLLDPPPPDFAFPYRTESLPALAWAAEISDDWIWDYLLALNLWALDREEEAAEIMDRLGQVPAFAREPAFAPAFVARALLLESVDGTPPIPDLQKAATADPETRILHLYLIRALQAAGRWEEAIGALDRASERFANADDFDLDLLRAKALINLEQPVEATEILAATHVLPSENARESHRLWEQAHIMAALDAYDAGDFQEARGHAEQAIRWPENLGQGRPYEPDDRLARFILGRVDERLGNREAVSDTDNLRSQLESMAEQPTTEVQRRLIRRALELAGVRRRP
jgi:tetratricopeptide (TPR) repeat protein